MLSNFFRGSYFNFGFANARITLQISYTYKCMMYEGSMHVKEEIHIRASTALNGPISVGHNTFSISMLVFNPCQISTLILVWHINFSL